MLKIIKKLKFKGNFSAFLKFLRTDKQFYAKTSKELLMFARDIAKRADEQLPRFLKYYQENLMVLHLFRTL